MKTIQVFPGDYVKFRNDGGQEFYGDVTEVYANNNTVDIQADGAASAVIRPAAWIIGIEHGGHLRRRHERGTE